MSEDLSENLPKKYWLIVHSEPLKEIEMLLDFAIQIAHKVGVKPFFVVVCALEISEKIKDNNNKNDNTIP